MAHLLHYDLKEGRHAFAKAGALAWHKLGVYLKSAMTSKEAIEEALLDWNVTKVAIQYQDPASTESPENSMFIGTSDFMATVREDTKQILGIVGKQYKVLQNHEMFAIVDDIVGSLEAVYETAGALDKGRKIFLTAKLPDYFTVAEEVVDQYLVVFNSHTGTEGLRLMFTPVCVVCNNTLQLAIRKAKRSITINHTASMTDKIKDITKTLGIINQLKEDLDTCLDRMSQTKCGSGLRTDYFRSVVEHNPALMTIRKNIFTGLEDYYNNGVGQDIEIRRNTVWGAYNAVTGYIQHEKNYRGPESKLKTVLNGPAWNIMYSAKNLALELCS